MSYKHELMSDEDKAYLATFNFTNLITKKPLKGYSWAIDRDNNSFLIDGGGVGGFDTLLDDQVPKYYYFVIDNRVFLLSTFFTGKGNYFVGLSYTYKVSVARDVIRNSCVLNIKNRDEFIEKIKEAIIASCTPIGVDCSVEVTFDYVAVNTEAQDAKWAEIEEVLRLYAYLQNRDKHNDQ